MRRAGAGVWALFGANLVIWGYNWVPLHLLLQDGGPASVAAIRVFGGAASIFVLLLARGRSIAPPRERPYVWIGLTQVGANAALTSLAVIYAGVSRAAILLYTMPFWAMLIARIFYREKISALRWLALAIAVCGTAMIAWTAIDSRAAMLGALCATGAGLAWAVGTTLALRSTGRDLLRSVAWEQLIGTVPLVLLMAIFREGMPDFTPRFIACALFSAIFSSGLGWVLWNRSAQSLAPSTLALGSLAIPLIAALSAYLQIGERPAGTTVAGLATILAALLVASAAGGQRRADPRLEP